eukprot:9698-Heterococcus_DN1.PRE.5
MQLVLLMCTDQLSSYHECALREYALSAAALGVTSVSTAGDTDATMRIASQLTLVCNSSVMHCERHVQRLQHSSLTCVRLTQETETCRAAVETTDKLEESHVQRGHKLQSRLQYIFRQSSAMTASSASHKHVNEMLAV